MSLAFRLRKEEENKNVLKYIEFSARFPGEQRKKRLAEPNSTTELSFFRPRPHYFDCLGEPNAALRGAY